MASNVPPPPGDYGFDPIPDDAPKKARRSSSGRPEGHAFDAEVDMGEIDERGRPGTAWRARSRSLSRSNIVILSRRMCYLGRVVLLAVHRIDARPVPLLGRVAVCEYDSDGVYRVDLDLLPMNEDANMLRWVEARALAA